ncbi:MAG: SurA N-terminal domain-containing protein [Bacteroidia bacterium]
MSTLNKIRSQAGLLVIVIGGALFIFILQSAFESGKYFFGNSDRNVGELFGKGIPYDEFNNQVEEAIAIQEKNSGKTTINDQDRTKIVQDTWQKITNETIMTKEYKALGITVSDDELYSLMLGKNPHPYVVQYFTDHQTGRIIQTFADPKTGQLNPDIVLKYTQQMNADQDAQWALLEDEVRKARYYEKYIDLIKAAMIVTTSQAKMDYVAQKTTFDLNYIMKRYAAVSDSSAKVSDSDLKNYYNAHLNDYKQERSRKLNYIAYEAIPSTADTADIKSDITTIEKDFKKSKPADDSSFVIAESDGRIFDNTYHKKGTLSPIIDSTMFSAEIGTVVGPYEENGSFNLAKLIDDKFVPDSVKARHILIRPVNGDLAKAKAKADSLKAILTDANFDEMAKANSEDGSASKGGDLGWFKRGQMVPEFDAACFFGKTGDIVEVQTKFGFHLIQLEEKSESGQKEVEVAIVSKQIIPGKQTLSDAYTKASKFSGQNNKADLFQKAVDANHLSQRIADVKESDDNIPGLDNPKELIRWAYQAKQGDVSQTFQFGNKFVVALLSQIKENGIAPLDQVKDAVTHYAMQDKKAEILKKEMNDAMAGTSNLQALAAKTGLQTASDKNASFGTNVLQGIGPEGSVIGVASVLKANQLSKPIQGQAGVFVISVDSIHPATPITDYKALQMQLQQSLSNQADYDVFGALKTNANVVDHIGKFY